MSRLPNRAYGLPRTFETYLTLSYNRRHFNRRIRPARVYRVIAASQPKNLVESQIWQSRPLLKHIASCESWGDPNKEPREFTANGQVLHGYPNPEDIGLAQINLPTWGATAAKLGFNLYTYQGNLNMAA